MFKCCVSAWGLKTFEKTRNYLIEKNLIKDKPTYMCEINGKQKWNPCYICHTDGMCTLKKDGDIKNVFMDEYKKEHKVILNQAILAKLGRLFSVFILSVCL